MDYHDMLIKAYVPTQADIKQELTSKQLEQLCRRTTCRVVMWKWNTFGSVAQTYRENGRFNGKTPNFINRLMMKTYKKNPDFFKADKKQREDEWYKEWCQRKKRNLMQLKLWKYDEEREEALLMSKMPKLMPLFPQRRKPSSPEVSSTQDSEDEQCNAQGVVSVKTTQSPLAIIQAQDVNSSVSSTQNFDMENHNEAGHQMDIDCSETMKNLTSVREQSLQESGVLGLSENTAKIKMEIPAFADPSYVPELEVEIKLENEVECIDMCAGIEPFNYVSAYTPNEKDKQTATDDASILNKLECCETKSLTVSTQSLSEGLLIKEEAPNLVDSLSKLLESPIADFLQPQPSSQSEPLSQPNTYDEFHKSIPAASTEDALFD